MSDEERKSIQAQVGYLTARVEDLVGDNEEMINFVRGHMHEEEIKITRIYKILLCMGILIVLQSAGLDLKTIFEILVALK